MIDLTANEQKILNNISRERDPGVFLGNKIQELIDIQPEEGTPVNAMTAEATLSVTGVVIDGETVAIDNPLMAGSDVYEFVTDAAKTKTAPNNIAVDIKSDTTASSGTLTMDTQPTSGDTVTIGSKTYIFVPVGTANADGEVSIGANLAGAQAALVAAVNGTDGRHIPHALVRAGNFVANASTITAILGGTIGDAIATTETFTAATNIFAAVTLGSGANCSAANAIKALVTAITNSGTQLVTAEGYVDDTMLLLAPVAGSAGNDILVSETMANGTFGADVSAMSKGVDATVSDGIKLLVDDTYLYVCLDANTIADSNWRRISLGSAYYPEG